MREADAQVEVLMLQRHPSAPFMGGAHVFPGGRVDGADAGGAFLDRCDGMSHAAAQLPDLPPEAAAAFHVAAVRELFEEAGILLAKDEQGHFARAKEHALSRLRLQVHAGTLTLPELAAMQGLRFALDALVAFAHWVTPPGEPRRFDTRFFLAAAPPGQTAAHDERETIHAEWITPAAAIAACRRGAIHLPPPTWTTLRELEACERVDDALALARRRAMVRREPLLVEEGGREMLVLPGDPLSSVAEPDPPRETRFVRVDGRWRAE